MSNKGFLIDAQSALVETLKSNIIYYLNAHFNNYYYTLHLVAKAVAPKRCFHFGKDLDDFKFVLTVMHLGLSNLSIVKMMISLPLA